MATAAHPPAVAGPAEGRWLLLAAEMAGLAVGTVPLPPVPADPVPANPVPAYPVPASPVPASPVPGSPVPAGPVPGSWAGSPRIATCTPGEAATSVRAARDFTVATARRWGAAERSHDIAIVVSELLTNALRYARPGPAASRPRRPIRLGLLQFASGLLCAVADPSTAAPVPQAAAAFGETGRGLYIVGALSDCWGYTASGTGKVVWAMFAAPLAPPLAPGAQA
jgi:anti-sigma regulatory factor (Ser/Thr protein kinase)